jgi:hypothetical protein
MKAIFKNSVDLQLDVLSTNKMNLEMTVQGGSTDEFLPENETDEPKNDEFIVRDVEKKVFVLDEDNTFNEDIMALLQTPVVDITGIVIGCYTVVDAKTAEPARFKVDLQLNTMVAPISMGYLSNLSLLNMMEQKIEKLVISDVKIEAEKTPVNLVVMVFSKNANEA